MSAIDAFRKLTGGSYIGSAEHAFAITPADGADLAYVTRAVYVGGAGAMKVDMHGGEDGVTFTGLVVGMIYPLRVSRVYSTGTSATNIIGLY